MPPNTIEIPVGSEPDFSDLNGSKPQISTQRYVPAGNDVLKITQATLSLLAHVLIGTTLAGALLFTFRNGLPLTATMQHIVLCVIGYQFLMAQAILSLSSESGWASRLSLVQRRRVHWILQIAGSALAIAGTIIKILDKTEHFNSTHGIFGLISLIFTSLCLINGLGSLYAYELRSILPGNLLKITHICFGIIAFSAASICLCFGLDKGLFRGWATVPLANTFISFVVILTFIIIINPFITFFNKTKSLIKK